MSYDVSELSALPAAEKLRIVEFLWDDLGNMAGAIPLPEWVAEEAARRREDMRDPSIGMTHDEVWHRLERRNG